MSLASTLSFLNASNKAAAASSSSSSSATNTENNNNNNNSSKKPLHIAIEGCSHGELDKIYEECQRHEAELTKKIDLLICCGDFQSVRSGATLQKEDLDSMHIPKRFLSTGDFPKYFSGEKKAPILTILIGGNHEASNFLFEEYYGGFLCENVYYLGHSGVINVGGLRIAGLSGIYKYHDFRRSYPVPPYFGDENKIRGAYHVRNFEIEKLKMLNSSSSSSSSLMNPTNQQQNTNKPIDIFISHDWPVGITDFGDVNDLLSKKPYFEQDIEKNQLGNPYTMDVLKLLRPRYWFAAHLHVRFKALVHHNTINNQNTSSSSSSSSQKSMNDIPLTEFLSLDKCVRQTHEFLQFMDIAPSPSAVSSSGVINSGDNDSAPPPPPPPIRDPFTNELFIYHDPDWVEIIKQTHANVPLDLNIHDHSVMKSIKTEWVLKSFVPTRAASSVNYQQQQRRGREQDNDEKTNEVDRVTTASVNFGSNNVTTKMIRSTHTIDLLRELGLTGDQQIVANASSTIHHQQHQQPQVQQQKDNKFNGGNEAKKEDEKNQDDNTGGGGSLGWGEDV